ncbi:MAG: CHASE2 domain-containing protein [Verrucomicrobia bacterium]|nr:CHASE2 domain-containing protein [Verrucomicrobiota bacterium]
MKSSTSQRAGSLVYPLHALKPFLARRLRWVAALAVIALVSALGVLLLLTSWSPGVRLVQASYDLSHQLAGPVVLPGGDPIIVYLDLQSHLTENQDPARPWPRALHARLLRRLTAAGARAVVFDIVFSGAGADASADEAFAAALRENGHTILGAELNPSSHDSGASEWTKSWKLELPAENLRSAAAGWGVTQLQIEDDICVRRLFAGRDPSQEPSLVWAAARVAGITNRPAPAGDGRWVRYYGPPLSLRHVSYSSALDPKATPDEIFRGKIVFVGARPMAGRINERRDEFRSPFYLLNSRDLFVPGVEIHATQLLNLMRGDSLRRLSGTNEARILLGAAMLFGAGLMWLRPLTATAAALAGAGAVLGLEQLGFGHGVWFPWLIVCAVQIPAALTGSYLFHFGDWFVTRRRLEAQRRVDEAKIREQAALIDKAHDAILVQSIDGRVLYANPGAEQLYGWTLAELQRDGVIVQLISPDAPKAAAARATAIAKGEWNGELRQQTRDGRAVMVASRWTLIRDEAGQPKALLLINSDITEKKHLEAQFLRAQRMETIGSLAGGMAHDLNNALSPILMGAQLLRRRASDTEDQHLLDVIEASTHRGADMVRQVLLFARGKEGDLQQLALGPLVHELEKMVRDTFPKSITVETFLPNDLWPVRGNPTQLHQVLLNLCVNARDAMPDGGRISFAADNVDVDEAEAAAHPGVKAGPFVSLLVSDTGSGMPPEVKARIFEPFFTTKGEGVGTGIGLATVLRIVMNHGGFLRVESAPGEGTTFEVLLPRALRAAAAAATHAAKEPPRGNGELILVADDEQAIRDLLAGSLTAQGYRVLTAADGAAAVSLFMANESEVRLFFTDSAMPSVDGLRAIQLIRQSRGDLPVILAGGEKSFELAGAILRLQKPYALDEVLWTVHRALHPETESKLGNA